MIDDPDLSSLAVAMRERLRVELDRIALELGLRTRVLVVEDDVDSARLMQRYLERRGHPVCLAYDVPEALSAASAFQPDVVVLDVGLPSGDGCELAPALRAVVHKPLRVVGLSGYDDPRYRARAEESGFDAYLIKPASLRTVALEAEREEVTRIVESSVGTTTRPS